MPEWIALESLLQRAFEKEGNKGIVQIQLEPDGNGQLVWRYGHSIEVVRCYWSNIEKMMPVIQDYLDQKSD
jgi:hypothetical protein